MQAPNCSSMLLGGWSVSWFTAVFWTGGPGQESLLPKHEGSTGRECAKLLPLYVVAWSTPFYCWMFHCMDTFILFSHSLVDVNLNYFRYFALMNNAALNILCLRVKWLGHVVWLLKFWGMPKCTILHSHQQCLRVSTLRHLYSSWYCQIFVALFSHSNVCSTTLFWHLYAFFRWPMSLNVNCFMSLCIIHISPVK